MTQAAHSLTYRQVLETAGVRRLWLGQLVSIAGDFLAIFAIVGIASFRLHATPAQITGVTIAYMLPLAIFGPVAGVFVDRSNVKYIMIASDLIRGLLVLFLLVARGLVEIYIILAAISLVSTFFLPAQSVTLRSIVPRAGLLTVNTLMQQTTLAMRLMSPAIAGALIGKFGAGACFYLDSVSFFCSALMLSGVAVRRLHLVSQATPPRTQRTAVHDLSAGVRFIATHPEISFVTTAIAAATFAISCSSPLLAVFVRDILHAELRTFAVISAAIGLGLIGGTQAVRHLAKGRAPRRIVVFGLAVIAGAILIMGSATLAMVLAAGAFAMGAGVGLLVAPAQTLIQSETPITMAGRVSSGITSLISTAQILGLTLSATLAGAIGIRTLFVASAALLGTLAVLGYAKLGSNRNLADSQLTKAA